MHLDASHIIGIDLGTTNSTIAYTSFVQNENPFPEIIQFPIPQAVNSSTVESNFSLPSFIYHPLSEELKSLGSTASWNVEQPFIIGSYARDRGAEVPTRLVASAKSWLCHPGINRHEKLLPLESEESSLRMSPVEACTEILRHIRHSWDKAMADCPFDKQKIFITVPASFDPSARELIQEASRQAGYPEATLLEEPQAAFYAWLARHPEEWRLKLALGDTVLVVDIGGGTTDFSLIRVEEEAGNLLLKRQSVGSHLLLGGDNIDLGLAHLVRQKLEDKGCFLDQWQMQSLIHSCREAKEKLMGDSPPDKVDLAILGRGSRLIGNTIKTELTLSEAKKFIIDSFVPFVKADERSPIERRAGIQQIGLPYAQDARISCQLAKFLSMTGELDLGKMDDFILPTAVLFNGGTLKSSSLRQQLMDLLNQWAKQLNKPPVKELEGADYDFAVSRGAAFYGLARQGRAVRIRSGTSRSYYIGVEEAVPAVPGFSPPLRAICVVPFGLEEGEECHLDAQEFALVLGEQATFRFFSHATAKLSNGTEAAVGTVIRNWSQELTELKAVEALLDKGTNEGKTVRVKLRSKVTELGMLELWFAAADGRTWKLEFDTRSSP